MEHTLKDSGERQEFETGARRDRREGKGRYDLIPPEALRRIALVYEKGSLKYSERNWEKGMPFTRFLDSALRHTNQYLDGQTEEDHLAQACFNLMAVLHFEKYKPELNDIPKR